MMEPKVHEKVLHFKWVENVGTKGTPHNNVLPFEGGEDVGTKWTS